MHWPRASGRQHRNDRVRHKKVVVLNPFSGVLCDIAQAVVEFGDLLDQMTINNIQLAAGKVQFARTR